MRPEGRFVLEMRAAFGPRVRDLADALYLAMDAVDRDVRGGEARYFGPVAGGTFYCRGDYDSVRWFPGADPGDAAIALEEEFGPAW